MMERVGVGEKMCVSVVGGEREEGRVEVGGGVWCRVGEGVGVGERVRVGVRVGVGVGVWGVGWGSGRVGGGPRCHS